MDEDTRKTIKSIQTTIRQVSAKIRKDHKTEDILIFTDLINAYSRLLVRVKAKPGTDPVGKKSIGFEDLENGADDLEGGQNVNYADYKR